MPSDAKVRSGSKSGSARSSSSSGAKFPSKSIPTDPAPAKLNEAQARLAEAQARVVRLWKSYKKSASQDVRNQLIENYLPLVRSHAERLKAKLPSVVQVDDLTTAGVLGLMDAIEQFDPDRNVKFETFSAIRIRGAMMDELRGLDWVPRLVRQRAKMLTDATAALRAELGRTPTQEEVAARMNVSMEEFYRIAADSQPANVFSLYGKRPRNTQNNDNGEEGDDVTNLCDDRSSNPVLQAQHKTLQEVLMRGFTRSERLIVLLYYYEQLTMKEIGATLDLSESRVSQMHTSIVQRLKVTLSDRLKELQATKVA
jgi:RNA polymerase sigma factor for flagellar operon FliA